MHIMQSYFACLPNDISRHVSTFVKPPITAHPYINSYFINHGINYEHVTEYALDVYIDDKCTITLIVPTSFMTIENLDNRDAPFDCDIDQLLSKIHKMESVFVIRANNYDVVYLIDFDDKTIIRTPLACGTQVVFSGELYDIVLPWFKYVLRTQICEIHVYNFIHPINISIDVPHTSLHTMDAWNEYSKEILNKLEGCYNKHHYIKMYEVAVKRNIDAWIRNTGPYEQ
jgi:hypothetical protein